MELKMTEKTMVKVGRTKYETTEKHDHTLFAAIDCKVCLA